MNTIADVFSPTLLGVFACLTLGVAAILFILSRRGDSGIIDLRATLSWSEPVEIRLILYLILGATCGVFALVMRLIFAIPGEGSFWAWLLLILALAGFAGNLAFFYASMGSLLQAAMGTRGRPPFWFSPLLGPVDGIIMDVGDVISGLLFRPAPPQSASRRRAQRDYEEYEDDFADIPPPRRPVRSSRARARPAPRRPVYEDYDDEPQSPGPDSDDGYEEEPPELEAVVEQGDRSWRGRGGRTRDIPRERLDLAIQEYESALTSPQREKLRLMREIVASIQQLA